MWKPIRTLIASQYIRSLSLVQNWPQPWQQGQKELMPGQVRRGLGALFLQIETPAVVC